MSGAGLQFDKVEGLITIACHTFQIFFVKNVEIFFLHRCAQLPVLFCPSGVEKSFALRMKADKLKVLVGHE